MARPVEERVVGVTPRTVMTILGLVIGTAILLWLAWLTRGVLVWLVIALFLAMALNPAVEWFLRLGVPRRGQAVAIVLVLVVAALVLIGLTFVPSLVREVNAFAEAVPGYVRDLTEHRGKLGELEARYHIVERLQDAVASGGVKNLIGFSDKALSIVGNVLHGLVALVSISFLTIFMLLEGPRWVERLYASVPDEHQPRIRRAGHDVYKTVSGYVIGNLAISVIAGGLSATVMLILGVPYALALALIVGILDLVPLAGATLAAIIVSAVAWADEPRNGIIMIVFFVLYQLLENHVIQPLVYRTTVKLSALTILVAVLIGAELGGVVGALFAIPVAGAIDVGLREWLAYRRDRAAGTAPDAAPLPTPEVRP
jgi:predicted PurR-regulated permease PerM